MELYCFFSAIIIMAVASAKCGVLWIVSLSKAIVYTFVYRRWTISTWIPMWLLLIWAETWPCRRKIRHHRTATNMSALTDWKRHLGKARQVRQGVTVFSLFSQLLCCCVFFFDQIRSRTSYLLTFLPSSLSLFSMAYFTISFLKCVYEVTDIYVGIISYVSSRP